MICIFTNLVNEMNLIIDVGNTFIKLAAFEDNILLSKISCKKTDFSETFAVFRKKYPQLKRGILSSVGDFTSKELSEIKKGISLFILSHEAEIPFKNTYATPTTLGVDRIALVSAAAIQHPKENVLIIDAGSCITYDFLNASNEYLGGAISPGIEMRYKSLNLLTDKLPLLEKKQPKNFIGDSTENSIDIGVVRGVANEIDGFIENYAEKYENLTVILTGGDLDFLRDSLKNDIFADSNFLLDGLNYILEHNKHTC